MIKLAHLQNEPATDSVKDVSDSDLFKSPKRWGFAGKAWAGIGVLLVDHLAY